MTAEAYLLKTALLKSSTKTGAKNNNLILGAIGLLAGGALGSLVYPLTTDETTTTGYLTAAATGGAVGIPSAILLKNMMSLSDNPLKKAMETVKLFKDGAKKSWDQRGKGPISALVLKEMTNTLKAGALAINLVRSLSSNPETDPGLFWTRLSAVAAYPFMKRSWLPTDLLPKGVLDSFKSIRKQRGDLIKAQLGLDFNKKLDKRLHAFRNVDGNLLIDINGKPVKIKGGNTATTKYRPVRGTLGLLATLAAMDWVGNKVFGNKYDLNWLGD